MSSGYAGCYEGTIVHVKPRRWVKFSNFNYFYKL